jgi:hypothetical protein
MDEYEVVQSCYARRCHPETCCCNTPYVVRKKNGQVIKDVNEREEGEDFIKMMKNS